MICAWIETSSAETGSSRTRKRGLTARARAIPIQRVGLQPDHLEQLDQPFALLAAFGEFVDFDPLADDRADPHARIERRVGILKHDLHLLAQLAQLAASQRR